MAYRIAICDDDEEQLQILRSLLLAWGQSLGAVPKVRCFPSAEAFLFAWGEDSAYDILVLDVEMAGLSGIGLAKRIRQEGRPVELLFVTSHFEFVSEGYEVDALHYLTKPVDRDKLFAALSKAADRLSAQPPSLILTCGGETCKLRETDILYVEAFLHYISVHTREREYRIKESISSFQERLSADFFRIHRSYLASLKHVARISRNSILLEGQIELPLARGKYDEINRAFIERN